MSDSSDQNIEDSVEDSADMKGNDSSDSDKELKLDDLTPKAKKSSGDGKIVESPKEAKKETNGEEEDGSGEEEDEYDDEVSISDSDENEGSFIDAKYDFDNPPPVLRFQYSSICATLIRAVNLFRASHKLPPIVESIDLNRIAMKHSLAMAKMEVKFTNAPIKEEISDLPFPFYYAYVSRSDSPNHAFLDVTNEWASEPGISAALLSKVNTIGCGMASTAQKTTFFTVIVAVKSYIGDSHLVGDELRSFLLGQNCLEIVNNIREKYDLPPYLWSDQLATLAYKFSQTDPTKITQKFISTRIPSASSSHVDFGKFEFEKANPKTIVSEWMQQTYHVDALLGEFNRIGIGFVIKKNCYFSVRIVTRSIYASIIDGSENLVDHSILAKHIAEEMNEFREQHSLEKLSFDDNLFKVAQDHAEFIANGQEGINPIEDDFYKNVVEPRYKLCDISHTTCKEMLRAPKEIMRKWRNNTDCVSVLLNQVDDIGVGVCFDEDYVCHVTTIICDRGDHGDVVNKIVSL
ncbi:protein-related family [Trichomonas vaginalis G3]|nr:protein-related family [Trichomonas vaginalis G3]KAI5547820.1 protein-related family [Trichomonas vaginalis G3]